MSTLVISDLHVDVQALCRGGLLGQLDPLLLEEA